MEVCKELIKLAKEFKSLGHKLYIVGGYIRNHLIGIDSSDIDITSSLPTQQVQEICSKLNIKTTKINSKLGTMLLTFNSYKFEYTQFRSESYNTIGKHTPDKVEFVEDIETDCKRRDFTINSIYYEILSNKIIDLSNGQKDISKRLIKTTQPPFVTLGDDGLRILRAIRFASTLNFKIEHKTYVALKTFTPLLKNISKERILKELTLLVVADLQHNISNTQFLNLCNKLKLPKYLFNSTLIRMKKFKKSDIYEFYKLNKNSRLIGFYTLVLKNYFKTYIENTQLEYNINMLLGVNGIKESCTNINITEKIYRILQNLNYKKDILNASINYLTLSDAEREIINAFLNKKSKQILSDKIKYIEDMKLPLSIHQMDITAQDLIDIGIKKIFISKILTTLYNQVLNMCVENTNSALKELAKQINETFLNFKEKP